MLQHVRIKSTPSPRPAGHSRRVYTSDQERWAAVTERDRRADGAFVYAVVSTGIFCRPSCPSRRPRRDRAHFFETPVAAERAGYRACRRCRPTADPCPAPSDQAIHRTATYLTAHADETVPLETLARVARLSPSHLQRQFTRALGLSPREYQAACRADRFRRALRAGRDVAGALYEAGYGSPSRVYESAPTGRGMSPASYRHGGQGVAIGYVIVRAPLGRLLVAATEKGICAVKLGTSDTALATDLRHEFPSASLLRDRIVPRPWVSAIVDRLRGSDRDLALPLDVRGTAFQWRVWRALQQIPFGEVRSYTDLARAIGQPAAVRAVARACATNPVCVVVPCHRVVYKDGREGEYRWGAHRKRSLLKMERRNATGFRKAK